MECNFIYMSAQNETRAVHDHTVWDWDEGTQKSSFINSHAADTYFRHRSQLSDLFRVLVSLTSTIPTLVWWHTSVVSNPTMLKR